MGSGSGSREGRRGRRSRRGLVWALAALVLVAVVLAGGTTAYVMAFRVERDPETVVVGVTPGLRDEAQRLADAFVAAGQDRAYKLVEVAAVEDVARSLESAETDFVLVGEGGLPRGVPDPVVTTFKLAHLLAVPFPSARTGVTRTEAEQMVADLSAGKPGPWADGGPSLIDLADRTSERQLLEVDGVYPTLGSVSDGTYPLVTEVSLAVREPRGLLGFLSRLPVLRGRGQANYRVAADFEAWLRTDAAKAAFYGTPFEVTLSAVGDVMLGRGVARDIEANGLDYPFALVADRLAAADITWCNLEAPLSLAGTPIPGKEIWLRGKPAYVECLRNAGIDILSAANNHILDFDTPCLLETLDTLDQGQIAHAGAGRNITEARSAAILERNGVKIAFLSYTEFADPGLFWSFSYRRTFLATDDTPGCAPLDMAIVAEDIARARQQADLVVVTYHWGWENIPYPQAWNPANDLEAIARQTIDLGANLVLGTHPHAVQGLEAYRGGLIDYSIGNFVNDQREPTQKEGTILEVRLGPVGVLSARVVPVWIDPTRPQVMEGAEARRLLEKIEEISAGFRSHQ